MNRKTLKNHKIRNNEVIKYLVEELMVEIPNSTTRSGCRKRFLWIGLSK